ncbi:MAG TPA: hemolysin family protein, partial [Alphaproteobacteria bacterium]|nr:hemolysin family protein [Alphaproteobacteria bacterium]
MWFELLIIFLLILANGFFAMAELAILSANKTRLRIMARGGSVGAEKALALADDSEHFIPAVQSAITILGACAGVFSGAAFAEKLGAVLNMMPQLSPHGEAIALPIIVVGVSYFSLVVGELVPKQLAVNHAERWAVRTAPFMIPFTAGLGFVVQILKSSTQLILKLFPASARRDSGISEEEVKAMVDEGTEGGVFEVAEQQMIKRVLRLADRPVRAIMTARNEIGWLNIHDAPEILMQEIAEMRHSAYPVCDGNLDHVIGVVRAKDLLDQSYAGQTINIHAVMQEAAIIPETASILSVLEKLKLTTIHMGFIVDEYGVLEGIVTELDILEAIVGALPDDDIAAINPTPAVTRTDGSILLDGGIAIDEAKEILGITEELPDEADYHTLGGIALGRIGRIPREGDKFELPGWQMEVMDMDGRRVDKLLAVK